jgi:hypothetical protein
LESEYYVDIAHTNFKRWIKYCKLRQDHPMPNFTPVDPLDDPQMKYLYFVHRLNDSYSAKLYAQGYRTPNPGLSAVLKWAVSEQSTQLFNKLLEYYPGWTIQTVGSEYGVQLPEGIKRGAKVIKLLS